MIVIKKQNDDSSWAIRFALLALLLLPIHSHAAWQLTWSDEFDQPNGSSPDSTKWGFDVGTGDNGWGNNQLEYDTARTNNARIQSGNLVIEARQENYGGKNYTSARMLTKGKWSQAYGRIEARIKIPRGQGIWPAFWMLGANFASVGWPECGEIDILENIGKPGEQGKIYGTIHGPLQQGGDYHGGGGVGGNYTLPGGAAFADDFHLYAIEWTTNQIKWFVDGHHYFTATPATLPSGGNWVFSQPQFFILNVAVGGNWPGSPDENTVFPQQMLVDYVRAYKFAAAPPAKPTGLRISPGNAKVFLNWDDSAAPGYEIKRAMTSGGPFIVVGTSDTNNFTDITVANCSEYYYVVSATNSAGSSANSSEQIASLGAFSVAVNSGGTAAGNFGADAYVTGGTIGAVSTVAVDTTGLVAPAPQAVYRAERYGNFTYTFPGLISGAIYKVRLHSAETYWNSVGQRRFNVTINGAQVLTNFDIIAAAGAPNRAVINEFNAVASNGKIMIQFTTVTDNARASGIEIILAQPESPTAENNGPIFAGMTLNLTASTVPGATYNWTGPNGFTSSVQNPSIPNASVNLSGEFSVVATMVGCTSPPTTTTVSVNQPAMVTAEIEDGSVILNWPGGNLQSAPEATGPWSDVSADSPHTNLMSAAHEFFRLRME